MAASDICRDERTNYVRQFYHKAKQLLSSAERNLLHQSLKNYHATRRVDILVSDLVTVLDTPQKLNLLREIRNLVPFSHIREFDRLAPYASMASPLVLPSAKDYSVDECDSPNAGTSLLLHFSVYELVEFTENLL